MAPFTDEPMIFLQPVSKQRLMKAEKVLEGEGSKLADLGIEYDDELLLVYKLEGVTCCDRLQFLLNASLSLPLFPSNLTVPSNLAKVLSMRLAEKAA